MVGRRGWTHTRSDLEKSRLKLFSNRDRQEREYTCPKHDQTGHVLQGEREKALTNRKDKAPPPHIEWKTARDGYHNDSYNELNNGEAPQNKADEKTNNIEHVACVIFMR